jgi:signal transduction histidine kinase/GAF domain-containing protein
MRRRAAAAPPTTARSEVEAFLEASRAVGRYKGNLRASLGAILDSAIKLLRADEGSILIAGEDGVLRIAASRGIPEKIVRDTAVTPGKGIAGTVFASGESLLLPGPIDVARFEGYVEKSRRIHGGLCVPLRAGEAVIGVLNLNLMRPGVEFDMDDLNVATLFAEHAGLAFSNAELLARTERTSSELEKLRAAGLRLVRSLDPEAVAESVLSEGLSLLGTGAGFVYLGDARRAEIARYRGFARSALSAVLRTEAFRRRMSQARVVSAADEGFASLSGDLGRSGLGIVPLSGADSRTYGVLAATLPAGDEAGALRLLEAFGREAGHQIANAILYREIESKERELETIVMSVSMPIVLVDHDGNFRTINPPAGEIFHLAPDFETGTPVRGKLSPQIEEMILEGDDQTREITLTIGDETRVWRAEVSTVHVGDSPDGRMLVLEDVTTERELEQRKRDFLAVIGHELRTPLTVIRGFASTLVARDEAMNPTMRRDAVKTILDQAARLERLLEDLLFVSKIEAHRPALHVDEADLVEIVEGALQPYRVEHSDRAFEVERASIRIPLRCDRVKVDQILRHLVDNAVKYSEAGSPVTVKITEHPAEIHLAVVDQGVGMYSGDIPRLFRVFGQLDSTSTRRHGGTGIGLAVAKTLVDAIGGRIWVQSMLGRGSEFTFAIPREAPQILQF